MAVHELKIRPEFFGAQKKGLKTFEIRRHDRNFEIGDIIRLMLVDSAVGAPPTLTGETLDVEIMYILQSTENQPFPGITPGYSIIGTRVCA